MPWIAALLLVSGVRPGAAQPVDCGRLEAALRAAQADTGPRDTGAFDRAADRQRSEMERTRRYAAQLNCGGTGNWFDGGGGPPPECRDIEDHLARMQDNLDQLEARAASAAQSGDTAGRAAALAARFNAACLGPAGGGPTDDGRNPAGPADFIDDLSSVPLDGDTPDGQPETGRSVGRTLCVRTCDGGWFPLAPRATSDQLGGLEQLCKASCPNTEARLYSSRDGSLAAATALDGSRYQDLPAAFQFQKTFSAACTCKPPGQSWVEALAGAEQLLDAGEGSDVTVTTALSDQMAKPGPMPAAPAPGRGKGARRQPATVSQPPVPDRNAVADGLRAVQAPTAGTASSGIGGPARADRVLGRGEGLKITTATPDGATKQIRLIVP